MQHGVRPRLGVYDKHWLVLDEQGNVVLAASSSRWKTHSLVRIQLGGPIPLVDRVYLRHGALAMSPWADEEGFVIPIARRDNTPTLVRVRNLGIQKSGWHNLRGCL